MKNLTQFLKNIEVSDNADFDYDIVESFAENVHRLRMERGITLEELSFRCDLHKNYISDVERGKRNVSLKAIKKLADGLEVEVYELFKND